MRPGVVEKTGYDDPVVRLREVEALQLLGGCVRLLGQTSDGLLLEEVVPGTPVSDLPDDAATVVLARSLRAMWRPVPPQCTLPTVAQECAPLTSDVGVPSRLVDPARAALAALLAAAPEPVVLHGDLHHGNLLRGPAGWVGIDPHGVTGDPLYDVGPLLLNPLPTEVAHLVGRRLDLLAAELAVDRDRLRQWGLVRAVLACTWSRAAGEPPPPTFLAVAHALAV